MTAKLSKRIACAFCAEPTELSRVGNYIELEVTVPESEGQERQLFGAHVACLSKAMREGWQVEVDLLIDPNRIGEPAQSEMNPASKPSEG